MAAMPMRLIEVQSMGQDLAQRTVCVKVRLGRLGNTRKVSNSQVEVDTDKSLLLISKFRGVTAECIRKYRKWLVCQ
jgi:hypothetical protein